MKIARKSANIEAFWTPQCDLTLTRIKEMLKSNRVLAFLQVDRPFILFTDASKFHMSAVLMQKDDSDKLCPVGYWSKAFKGSQLFWSALVKEAHAVMEAVQHFDVFLKG